MVWNNVYLSTPNPVGNFQGSAASTVLSDLSVAGSIDAENVDVLGALAVTGVTTLSDALNSASAISVGGITATTIDSRSALSVGEGTFTGGNFASTITSTDGDFLSVDSQADSSGMTVGQLRIVFAASGVSLMYSSGESEYIVGQSAVSLAQS